MSSVYITRELRKTKPQAPTLPNESESGCDQIVVIWGFFLGSAYLRTLLDSTVYKLQIISNRAVVPVRKLGFFCLKGEPRGAS